MGTGGPLGVQTSGSKGNKSITINLLQLVVMGENKETPVWKNNTTKTVKSPDFHVVKISSLEK